VDLDAPKVVAALVDEAADLLDALGAVADDPEAARVAAPWPALQAPSDRLSDYVDELPGAIGRRVGTRYGDAVMGYALIEAGLRARSEPGIHRDPGGQLPKPLPLTEVERFLHGRDDIELIGADPIASAATARADGGIGRSFRPGVLSRGCGRQSGELVEPAALSAS
jgi:hypothetical protein